MSWLRDHFYTFVYPAFLAAEKRSDEIGPPVSPMISASAPKHLPTELQRLWSLCAEHGVQWSYGVKETAPSHGGWSLYRKSAQIHDRILRNTLQSATVAMRAEKCSRLFFAGRDVWTLAVLSERRNIPYLFIPEISRNVVTKGEVKPFLEKRGFRGDELFVDTGFVGSIPKKLQEHFGQNFKFRLMSQEKKAEVDIPRPDEAPEWVLKNAGVKRGEPQWKSKVWRYMVEMRLTEAKNFNLRPEQLFPSRKNARTEALETEYLAKYWKTGTVNKEGEIVQYLATKEHIQRAAILTSMLWRGVADYDPMSRMSMVTDSGLNLAPHYGPANEPHISGVNHDSKTIVLTYKYPEGDKTEEVPMVHPAYFEPIVPVSLP